MNVLTSFAYHVPKDIRANLRYRAAIHRRALEDLSFRNAMRDACAQDPIFYINTFGYTYDPRCQPFAKIPFILYPFQRDGILEIIKAIGSHDLLIEKSRDHGASWMCILSIEWAWHFSKLGSYLMVSRVEDLVDNSENPKSLFWKIDFFHKNLPTWLMPNGYNRSEHRRKLHILNPETGSSIDGESTTGQTARGDRRTAILLDEFAAVEQGYSVLASTRDATNCRIFNSTPSGVGNAYYDIRQTGIKKLRFHWSGHPKKNKGLYQTDKDGKLDVLDFNGYPDGYNPILDGKLRSPWYDIECTRVTSQREIAQELDIDYLGSGHQYFLAGSISDAITKYTRPSLTTGNLEYDTTTAEVVRFMEDPSGHIHLWCLLDKEGNVNKEHPSVLGADVSAGTGSTNSCLCGYDAQTNEKVLEYANPYIRPEEFAKQAVAISRWLGNAHLIWESNGPGRQFGSRVMELGYGNVYLRRREESLSKRVSDVPGWAATKETKLVLLGDYRAAVEKGLIINRSKIALEECLEYIFDTSGGVSHSRESNRADPTGAKSNHGDRVIADALAWRGLSEKKKIPVREKSGPPIGSLAWRMEMRENAKPKKGRELSKKDGW